jgi:aminoglycoside phosphotransferase (APT) family kinase protein
MLSATLDIPRQFSSRIRTPDPDDCTALLDVDFMAARIAHWPRYTRGNTRISRIHVNRIHQRSSGALCIEYEVTLDSADGRFREMVFALPGQSDGAAQVNALTESLRKKRRGQLPRDLPGATTDVMWFDEDMRLLFRVPGFDEKLPGLRLLHDAGFRRGALTTYTTSAAAQDDVGVRLLGHRLGKRAVLEIGSKSKHIPARADLIIKCFRSRGHPHYQAARRLRELIRHCGASDAALSVPKPIFLMDDIQAMVMKRLPGAPIMSLDIALMAEALESAGRALDALSRLPLHGLAYYGARRELEMLEMRVALAAAFHPDLSPMLYCAMQRVGRNLNRLRPVTPKPSHRDFHDKQIFVDEQGVTLIDFDTLCLADPALDAGNFVAHLELLELQGQELPVDAKDRFLACQPTTPGALERLDTWRDAARLRLACLYLLTTRWHGVGKAILERLQ